MNDVNGDHRRDAEPFVSLCKFGCLLSSGLFIVALHSWLPTAIGLGASAAVVMSLLVAAVAPVLMLAPGGCRPPRAWISASLWAVATGAAVGLWLTPESQWLSGSPPTAWMPVPLVLLGASGGLLFFAVRLGVVSGERQPDHNDKPSGSGGGAPHHEGHYHIDLFVGPARTFLRGPVLCRVESWPKGTEPLYTVHDDDQLLPASDWHQRPRLLSEQLRDVLRALVATLGNDVHPCWNSAPWEVLGYTRQSAVGADGLPVRSDDA